MPRVADHRAKIELLRAAEMEFAERGLAETKVEAITFRAGVSKGAFYLHFPSKEDCFRTIVEGFIARLAALVEHACGDQPMPSTLEELRAHVVAQDATMLDLCWQNRRLLRMLLDGGGGAPHAYLIEEFRARTRKLAEEGIRRAQLLGLYRSDLDAPIVAAIFSGGYDRLVRDLLRHDRRPPIEAWCGQLFDLFARGLISDTFRARSNTDPKVKS